MNRGGWDGELYRLFDAVNSRGDVSSRVIRAIMGEGKIGDTNDKAISNYTTNILGTTLYYRFLRSMVWLVQLIIIVIVFFIWFMYVDKLQSEN